MKLALIFALALVSVRTFAQNQTLPPGQLTVAFDVVPCSATPWLVTCVSMVNGRPVCPYGRVGVLPIPPVGSSPGQPYTVFNYPKVDQNGKPIDFGFGNSIPGTGCVWTLPPLNPLDPTTRGTGAHF